MEKREKKEIHMELDIEILKFLAVTLRNRLFLRSAADTV